MMYVCQRIEQYWSLELLILWIRLQYVEIFLHHRLKFHHSINKELQKIRINVIRGVNEGNLSPMFSRE